MSGYTSLDKVRQNYKEEVESRINQHVLMELQAFYTYLSMSYYYDQADVALPNFASYFKKCADEALEHAQKFMKHQNDRGGKLTLSSISKPKKDEWGTALEGLNSALSLERELNQAVLGLHGFCDENDDYHSADFIEGNFLDEHVKAIKELTSHICNINRVGVKEIGEYVFERQSISN